MSRILHKGRVDTYCTIILPGIFEEMTCKSPGHKDMLDVLIKVFDFRDITIKFLKNNPDLTASFSDNPYFINGLAQFRVYRGSKFITMGELRKW